MVSYINKYQNILTDITFSNHQCGFSNGLSTQHSPITLLQKWRIIANNSLTCGILLIELLKSFHCLPHDLLIAKLLVYNFDARASCFIHDYLRDLPTKNQK